MTRTPPGFDSWVRNGFGLQDHPEVNLGLEDDNVYDESGRGADQCRGPAEANGNNVSDCDRGRCDGPEHQAADVADRDRRNKIAVKSE